MHIRRFFTFVLATLGQTALNSTDPGEKALLDGMLAVDGSTGKYPQFAYWLAMPFFAPVPWEADAFYNQPGMREKNLVLDWWPVGTGPYRLTVNQPNRQMRLTRNPNFRGEPYPTEGMPEDVVAELSARPKPSSKFKQVEEWRGRRLFGKY
jgi:ABC-type transport system substrate-binding protein